MYSKVKTDSFEYSNMINIKDFPGEPYLPETQIVVQLAKRNK
jgi:hypothetical protein